MLCRAEGFLNFFYFLIFSAEQLGILEAAAGLLGHGSCVLTAALTVGGSMDCLSALVPTTQFLVHMFLQIVTNQDHCEHLEA